MGVSGCVISDSGTGTGCTFTPVVFAATPGSALPVSCLHTEHSLVSQRRQENRPVTRRVTVGTEGTIDSDTTNRSH